MNTVALIILDGVGLSDDTQYNAIAKQGMPHLTKYIKDYPSTTLSCSGRDVGLPQGQMGNSEVGHLNIGAGRIVYQDMTLIDKSIEDGDFFCNDTFVGAMDNCVQNKSSLHLLGLFSDGGVHSKLAHMYAILQMAKDKGVRQVYVHAITDGRDVAPKSASKYLRECQETIDHIGIGTIATVTGRFYCMDRDNRWERIQPAYQAIYDAKASDRVATPQQAIQHWYDQNITDEFFPATVIGDYEGVRDSDSVIMFNYRSDRARQITKAALDKDFVFFNKKSHKDIFYVGMTRYDVRFDALGIRTAFAPRTLRNTLGEYLADNSRTQARIAETEKYAHVSFFLNGGIEEPYQGERRILVNSPKVATYDLQPEMSAREVTDNALAQVKEGVDVLVLNYANCDMVGHTGNMEAAIKAVEVVDNLCYELTQYILSQGGSVLIVADHGNIEQLAYEDGTPHTAHTTNPVPFVLLSSYYKDVQLRPGILADIAPTMLEVLGLEKPKEMEGSSLIIR